VHLSRASILNLAAAVAFVLVGVWGAVNLSEQDWFVGALMLAAAVAGLWSIAARLLQGQRRR
jgi:hypothetical protein